MFIYTVIVLSIYLESISSFSKISRESGRDGIPRYSLATLKANTQFDLPSVLSRLPKSMRSGLNLAIIAQKASPDFQETVKSWTLTWLKSAVTCLHHCSNAGTCSIVSAAGVSLCRNVPLSCLRSCAIKVC